MSFDNEITASGEQLQSLGIVDPGQARKNLDLLAKTFGSSFSGFLPLLFSRLPAAADPDMALNNLERFTSLVGDVPRFLSLCSEQRHFLASLLTIFGASRFLSAFLMTDVGNSLSLLSDPGFLSPSTGKQPLAERLAGMAGGETDERKFLSVLRLFRKREMLRIALRDLSGDADLRETVEDLSDLAEVCLEAACDWAGSLLVARYGRPLVQQPDGTASRAGFAVIAMGKLGGRELNFSSDVDLMYVYSSDGETEGVTRNDGTVTNRITNHQYFIKLAEKLSAAIGEKTGDGFVFRVDLRLRPEGQRGPLAQSLGGYEIYYESWGQTWERSALIKARPVAGNQECGREFLERIRPFVYRKYLDYGSITEIRDMKEKINKDVEQKGRTHRDVKLGYGGIREIEFVIQALQLIYAGRDRTLRERNSLKALHLLSLKGLITYREHGVLSRAYTFLRTVEHRIQQLDDLQTQTIPSSPEELRALARRAGFREPGREADALLHEYAEHTQNVRAIYDNLFAFTGEEPQHDHAAREYELLLDADRSEQEIVDLFRRYGFADPSKAYRNLVLLREGAAFVHQTPRSRRLFNEIFPLLFEQMTGSPDPDMALNHLESFLSAQGSWDSFQSLLRLDASAGRILIAIFANSEYLSRMLISRPGLLESLLESRRSYGRGTRSVFARDLAAALAQASGITDKLDALRRFKHQEEIRIGMADLLAGMSLDAVSRDLSKLAEVCLEAALGLAFSEIAPRSGAHPAGIAIIGLGKLGGRELTYGSDLDILFVYSGSEREQQPGTLSLFEYYSRVAEKTISYLSTLTREGFAFRIDTRLRPTGSKGPLVQTVEAFRSYFSGQAETWERQAVLRARTVAGDRKVGGEFCSVIRGLIFRGDDRELLARDVRLMRRRMEEELGREDRATYNIKQGAGGMVDIEFLVQYLQLFYGKNRPRVQVPGTRNALHALAKEGLLPAEDHCTLRDCYAFLRRLESRMRIVSNQATSELTRDPARLLSLARRLGYHDDGASAGSKLLDAYLSVSTRIRDLFKKYVNSPV